MSGEVKALRDKAARALRHGRTVKKDKAVFNEVAATYKRLALREELLRGDRPRSGQRPSKR
jgi:hypothetical protein